MINLNEGYFCKMCNVIGICYLKWLVLLDSFGVGHFGQNWYDLVE